jgi:isoleucyl-tRNA synthetase
VQDVAAAIGAADAAVLSEALRGGGPAAVSVDGEAVLLGPDEVVVTRTPRQGWAFAQDAGVTVALDLAVTPELRRAGIARDVVRQLQEARKAAGLEISDRVVVRYEAADEETAAALAEHAAPIAEDVLATDFARGRLPGRRIEVRDDELGLTLWLRRAPRPSSAGQKRH